MSIHNEGVPQTSPGKSPCGAAAPAREVLRRRVFKSSTTPDDSIGSEEAKLRWPESGIPS